MLTFFKPKRIFYQSTLIIFPIKFTFLTFNTILFLYFTIKLDRNNGLIFCIKLIIFTTTPFELIFLVLQDILQLFIILQLIYSYFLFTDRAFSIFWYFLCINNINVMFIYLLWLIFYSLFASSVNKRNIFFMLL